MPPSTAWICLSSREAESFKCTFILKSLFVDAAHVAGAKLVITSQVL